MNRLIETVYALAAAAIIVLSSGCLPTLTAESVAPPGRAARLDPISGFWQVKDYRLELSQGVAIAVTCNRGAPCRHMRLRSEDSGVAEVRSASLGKLEGHGPGQADQATAAALVVVGKTPGKTQIRITTDEGDRTIYVTVIAPPIRNPQTAAIRN